MGVFTPGTGDNPTVTTAEGPKIYADDYKSSIVDSVYVHGTSLLTFVTGTPVRTQYYRQYLGADEVPVGPQLDDINTYQSYTRINDLIMKFEGKPAYSFDTDTAESTETGGAYVIFDLNPIQGDVFIRDIGDGRAGIYVVEGQPELRSYAADKVYFIQFKLIGLMTQAIEDNFNSKVVREYYYSKDSALNGGNALLSKDRLDGVKELMRLSFAITQQLLRKNYFNPEETITFKNEEDGFVYYDPYLTRFLTYVLPYREFLGVKPINLINTQVGVKHNYNDQLTVYDALLQMNKDLLAVVPRKMHVYSRRQFFGTRTYGSPLMTKIDRFYQVEKLEFDGIQRLNLPVNGYILYPDPEPGSEEDFYFSNGFFDGVPANEFERLTLDFFFNKVRDRDALLAYAKTVLTLPDKDLAYQGGVVVAMIELSRKVLTGE
ncbi:hypothetical protein KPN8_12 [Klebsiella phage KPN8]|nr:hypothetical protein KPN8_12 [Klebsiella phage KPN8]